MSRSMPLEVIRVPEPCKADWDAMTGDAAKRFCAGCQKHVHNLSAMPREQAERLVCESAGRLCVRFETEADGTVVTLDYDEQKKGRFRGGWKLWTLVGVIGAGFAGIAHALVGTAPGPTRTLTAGAMVMPRVMPPPVPPANAVMGEMIAPVAPPPACITAKLGEIAPVNAPVPANAGDPRQQRPGPQ